ncbi:hypothetical protein D3C83_238470 [compost metagenome]
MPEYLRVLPQLFALLEKSPILGSCFVKAGLQIVSGLDEPRLILRGVLKQLLRGVEFLAKSGQFEAH